MQATTQANPTWLQRSIMSTARLFAGMAFLSLLLISAQAATVLVTSPSGGFVRSFSSTSVGDWVDNGDFASAGIPYGANVLTQPFGIAQRGTNVYIAEGAAGGRILAFDLTGAYQKTVFTFDATITPRYLAFGPDGYLYLSDAFGTAGDKVFRVDVTNDTATIWIPTSFTNAANTVTNSFNNPQQMVWGPDGFFYIGDRQNNQIRKFTAGGVWVSNVVNVTNPLGLMWDDAANRLLAGAGFTEDIDSILLSGSKSNFFNGAGSEGALSIANINGKYYYSRFSTTAANAGVFRIDGSSARTKVTGAILPASSPGQMVVLPVTGAGALLSLRLNVVRTQMLVGTSQSVQVVGIYENATNDITGSTGIVYASGNQSVLTVSQAGVATSVGTGTTTVSATYSNLTGNVSITVVPLTTTLIHRYDFSSGANDLVGANNGTLIGPSATVANGMLNLAPSSQFDFNYADFGPDAISGQDAITFEAWASFGTNYAWARLFDFGNTDGVSALSSVMLTPRTSGGNTRLALRSGGTEQFVDAPGSLDSKTNQHIVAVLHPLAGYMKLYINGVLAGQNLAVTRDLREVTNTVSYIGQSLFYTDPAANLSLDEFRIYSGVLFPTNVAFNAAAGPGAVISNPGALLSVTLAPIPDMPELSGRFAQLDARGNFANVTNVPLASFTGVTFSSSDTNVATVSSNGVVTALNDGTATITASYLTQSDSKTIHVTALTNVTILVADGGSNRIQRFEATGYVGSLVGTFAEGNYAGKPLTNPISIAQDANGNVYVGEGIDGGRLLKFSNTGEFVSVLATEGVDFTGRPDCLFYAPDGNLYMSISFTANNAQDRVYKIALPSGAVSVFIDTSGFGTGGSYTLTNPRGLALDTNGVLYVSSRGGFSATARPILKFNLATGDYLGELVNTLTSPSTLEYDPLNDRVLVAVNSIADIYGVTTNGAVSQVFNDALGRTIRGMVLSESSLYFVDFTRPSLFMVTGNGTTVATVAGGLSYNAGTAPGAGLAIKANLPPVASAMGIQRVGNDVIVTWSGPGTLQTATSLTGQFSDVLGATSPYTNSISGGEKYFRVKVR